jgi:conjugal transfer pilus assembly protein TraI
MRHFSETSGSLGFRAASDSSRAASQAARISESSVAYPPVDPGLPALTTEELLEPHRDLIDRIKACYGVDRGTYEREVLSLIRRYAEFVNLLPATPDNYFNAHGGLLRLGLEVAFFSLQGTDGHIFSGRSTISTRRQLEPRWRCATFIAGLCCEIHRTLGHVVVSNEAGGEWQPYLLPLSAWLSGQRVPRFFVKWLRNAHESRALGLFALRHVIPADVLQHLATGNSIVVPHLMASITGMPLYREHNIIDDLVRRSVALVIDCHLQASDGYGKPQVGAHLERYLVDAMRRLVNSNSAWKPNAEKSRVWFGADGLFIVWPNAAIEIRKLLESDQLPGIPKEPETILQILLRAGVFEAQGSSQATWEIIPPGSRSCMEAVKVSSPAVLFAGFDSAPSALELCLVGADVGSRTTPAPAVAAVSTVSADKSAENCAPGKQLELAIDRGTSAREGGVISAGPEFKLDAPIRLIPAVREALAQIVDTLNRGGTDVAACTVSTGVFIPLIEFERRKIEPSLALRALSELNMLARAPGVTSRTAARDFGGEQKVGLVLSPHFVAGLDAANFDTQDT